MSHYFTHYTTTEGGEWLPWTAGEVDELSKNKSGKTFVNGVEIHSLCCLYKFDMWPTFQRWDCLNGWTT